MEHNHLLNFYKYNLSVCLFSLNSQCTEFPPVFFFYFKLDDAQIVLGFASNYVELTIRSFLHSLARGATYMCFLKHK